MQFAMYVLYYSTWPWVYAQFWRSAVECNNCKHTRSDTVISREDRESTMERVVGKRKAATVTTAKSNGNARTETGVVKGCRC